jgi:hypothetical protein
VDRASGDAVEDHLQNRIFCISQSYFPNPASSDAPNARADQSKSPRPFDIADSRRSRNNDAIGMGVELSAAVCNTSLMSFHPNINRIPAAW